MIQYEWRKAEFTNGTSGWICKMTSRRRKIGAAHVVYNRRKKDGLVLGALHIKPQYQRQRYGKQLLQHIIDEVSPDWSELRLMVQPFADKAMDVQELVRFYQRFGFVQMPSRSEWPIMRRLLFQE